MESPARIGLVGDHDPAITSHRAIPLALDLARAATGALIEWMWIGTPSLAGDPAATLAGCARHQCLDDSRSLSQDPNSVGMLLEEFPVGRPGWFQRFRSIMEQVDVPGDPRTRRQLVEGRIAGDVARAARESVAS